jgi:sulfur dioxygenase
MIFRQMFEPESCTYTYMLASEQTRQAILIDTVKQDLEKYLQLLRELNLQLIYVADTHTHADHITAAGALRDATGCTSLLGKEAASDCVSKHLNDGDIIQLGELQIHVLHTPGHTDDSYSFWVKDSGRHYVFTGDTLLIRGTGRTDFQNGSASDQYKSLFHLLLKLPEDTLVYPGHDYKGWTCSSIGEERAHNPRLQVASESEYVDLMNNLTLPNPKLMDIAVPANRSCGKS